MEGGRSRGRNERDGEGKWKRQRNERRTYVEKVEEMKEVEEAKKEGR